MLSSCRQYNILSMKPSPATFSSSVCIWDLLVLASRNRANNSTMRLRVSLYRSRVSMTSHICSWITYNLNITNCTLSWGNVNYIFLNAYNCPCNKMYIRLKILFPLMQQDMKWWMVRPGMYTAPVWTSLLVLITEIISNDSEPLR